MSKALKYTFLIHLIVAVVLGVLLLVAPGRVLAALGWLHIDSMISRILGAALLGLAWGSWRCWQAKEMSQVKTILEMEVVVDVLGALGMLRELVVSPFPPIYWVIWAILVIFAIAWSYFLLRK